MIFGWLGYWLRARQRRLDLQILWPVCLRHARDLDHAKAAFMLHVAHDEAWTADFNTIELIAYVDKLRPSDRHGGALP